MSLQISLGSVVEVKRMDGSVDSYIFRGTDQHGWVLEDGRGERVSDFGMYREVTIKQRPADNA